MKQGRMFFWLLGVSHLLAHLLLFMPCPSAFGSSPLQAQEQESLVEVEERFYRDLRRFKARLPHIKDQEVIERGLLALEEGYATFLTSDTAATAALQGLMAMHGVKSHLEIVIPEDQTSYWLRHGVRLEGYQSSLRLPKYADFVVIGSGLTGASAAYHLSKGLDKIYNRALQKVMLAAVTGSLPSNRQIVAQVLRDFEENSQTKEDHYGPMGEKIKKALRVGTLKALAVWRRFKDPEKALAQGLRAAMESGPRVVILDRGEVSQEASGRNGGNIHSIPEVYDGRYIHIELERYEFTKRLHPDWSHERLQAAAVEQAAVILSLAKWTRALIAHIPTHEGFSSDFSPGGWLRIALDNEELEGLRYEQKLLARIDLPSEMLTPDEIYARYGYRPALGGRFTPKDAIYHPYKFATGLLTSGIRRYGVLLYTNTPVQKVDAQGADGLTQVTTANGNIKAYKVIAATNAFSSDVIGYSPIQPVLSQIMCTENLADKTKGGLVTENQGYIYYQQPRVGKKRAPLLMGGPDIPVESPDGLTVQKDIHAMLLAHRNIVFPEAEGIPPSAEWVGAMGFTVDRMPAIGPIRPGLLIAAGFNGFGGTYTVGAGKAIAKYALRGRSSRYVPLHTFDPHRLL